MRERISLVQIILKLLIIMLGFPATAHASDPDPMKYQDERLRIEWLLSQESLRPGDHIEAGFRVQLSPKWHIYWRNPGDSGTPPRMTWLKPEGWSLSEFQWPAPVRIAFPPLVNYGYENEVYLPFTIHVPDQAMSQGTVDLAIELKWLVCEENCIPGEAIFKAQVPVLTAGESTSSISAAHLEQARSSLPKVYDQWTLMQTPRAEQPFWEFTVDLPDKSSDWQVFDFFPFENTGVGTQDFEFKVQSEQLMVRLPKSDVAPLRSFGGILTLAMNDQVPPEERVVLSLESEAKESGAALDMNQFWLMLGFAICGGIILNLMPCVLPVLSIKVLHLVQSERDGHLSAKLGALAYTSGVMATFVLLASILFGLKSLGLAAGWGFQLQSPYFIGFLALLFFTLSLNFLGLISPWDAFTRLGQFESTTSHRFLDQFFSGILAVMVASPCTAPFMGVAMGYAVAQPFYLAVILFIGLGFGFSAPFLLLGLVPQSLRFLPKPGAWMETFRQFMAFPLLATVLWLLWVLGQQLGFEPILYVLLGFLFIGLGVWIQVRQLIVRPRYQQLMWLIITGMIVALLWHLPTPTQSSSKHSESLQTSQGDEIVSWEQYDPTVIEAIKGKSPIFIDFTAAWCVTCQVNKKLVLQRDEISELFKRHQFRLFRADWTDYNPVIGKVLESYGRSGVPVYVLYPSSGREPVLLPEILTLEMVKEYVEQYSLK